MNKEKEDPFIIIKDHRTKQANQRVCLRVLDANLMDTRTPNLVRRSYSYEDKENCMFLEDESQQMLKMLPKPSHSELINYSEYDLHFQ